MPLNEKGLEFDQSSPVSPELSILSAEMKSSKPLPRMSEEQILKFMDRADESFDKGDFAKAAQYYSYIINAKDNRIGVRLNAMILRALANTIDAKYELADQDFQEIIRLDAPDNGLKMVSLHKSAMVEFAKYKIIMTLNFKNSSIQASTLYKQAVLTTQALHALDDEKINEAIAFCESAISLDVRNPEMWFLAGVFCSEKAEYCESKADKDHYLLQALHHFTQSLELYAKPNAKSHFGRACVHFSMGGYDKAFRDALEGFLYDNDTNGFDENKREEAISAIIVWQQKFCPSNAIFGESELEKLNREVIKNPRKSELFLRRAKLQKDSKAQLFDYALAMWLIERDFDKNPGAMATIFTGLITCLFRRAIESLEKNDSEQFMFEAINLVRVFEKSMEWKPVKSPSPRHVKIYKKQFDACVLHLPSQINKRSFHEAEANLTTLFDLLTKTMPTFIRDKNELGFILTTLNSYFVEKMLDVIEKIKKTNPEEASQYYEVALKISPNISYTEKIHKSMAIPKPIETNIVVEKKVEVKQAIKKIVPKPVEVPAPKKIIS